MGLMPSLLLVDMGGAVFADALIYDTNPVDDVKYH